MENSEKKEINFWPYAIVGMILTVVMLSVWTIKVALKNPVQLENSYMMKYQDVDENINEILTKQRAFDSKYSVILDSNRLKKGQNRATLKILDREGNAVKSAKVTALVTRPDTAEHDIELKNFTQKNGLYESEEFELGKEGRWNILFKIEVGEDMGFKK
ncbi:MAG: FixH family protein, partial [Hydrogenimonas sp.]|nr:FixH family protein [Hydrogenimonas sp.]